MTTEALKRPSDAISHHAGTTSHTKHPIANLADDSNLARRTPSRGRIECGLLQALRGAAAVRGAREPAVPDARRRDYRTHLGYLL
jgi:hypothetical protein